MTIINKEENNFAPQDPSMMETPFSKINAINVIQTPTNPNWIKDKKGLSYVSGDTVTRILNKAFNYRWSFEILETRIIESQDKAIKPKYGEKEQTFVAQNPVVQCHGRLTIPGFGSREQWGSQPLIGGSDVQEHSFKSAATDSMKKCASLFGIALDLYGQDGIDDLKVHLSDFLVDDEAVIAKMKERMRAEQKAREEASQPKQEAPQQTEAPVAQPAPEPIPVVEEAPTASQVEVLSQEALETAVEQVETNQPEAFVEAVVAPEPEPAQVTQQPQPDYMMGVPKWDDADVAQLKNLKQQLGNISNEELSVYAQEFFGIPEATYLNINPHNIKDFNSFLMTKLG